MASIIDWSLHGNTYKAVHQGIHLSVRKEDGAYTWRAFLGASAHLRTSREGQLPTAKLEAERFARKHADERQAASEQRKNQPSPESTPKATTQPGRFERGDAVVLRKGRTHVRQLLAIVVSVTSVPVGQPGPHRYRYTLKPARIQDGAPVAIDCFANVDDIRASVLTAYDETTHGGNLAKWRVL